MAGKQWEGWVDRGGGQRQGGGMNRKPEKVEETAAPYVTKMSQGKAEALPAKEPGTRQLDLEAVRKNNATLLKVHRKVLQKLAQ